MQTYPSRIAAHDKRVLGSQLFEAGFRLVTGTTDTILASDRGKTIVYNSASAVAVTLPYAARQEFRDFGFNVVNIGAGTVTITPTTSTIDTVSSLQVKQNKDTTILSDNSNYYSLKGNAGSPFEYLGGSGTISAGWSEIKFNTAGWFDSSTLGLLAVISNARPATDAVNYHVQGYTDGGTTPIGAVHDYINNGRNSADTAKTASAANASQFLMNMTDTVGNAANETFSGLFFMPNPSATDYHMAFWLEGYFNTSTVFQGGMGSGAMKTTTALNALRWLWSTGNYAAGGSINMWRIKNT